MTMSRTAAAREPNVVPKYMAVSQPPPPDSASAAAMASATASDVAALSAAASSASAASIAAAAGSHDAEARVTRIKKQINTLHLIQRAIIVGCSPLIFFGIIAILILHPSLLSLVAAVLLVLVLLALLLGAVAALVADDEEEEEVEEEVEEVGGEVVAVEGGSTQGEGSALITPRSSYRSVTEGATARNEQHAVVRCRFRDFGPCCRLHRRTKQSSTVVRSPPDTDSPSKKEDNKPDSPCSQ